jgi:ADP-heptose:LPS heptosyltransferase/glycosyltransferase involved in cell wall biosynthesis/SAM-dependent methyltransferase
MYYQPILRPKVYEAHHESSGDTMSDADKSANFQLATGLYGAFKKRLPNGYTHSGPIRHLDIGSKFPYLGHCLQKVSNGEIESHGIDGIDEAQEFGKQLGVNMYQKDFENDDLSSLGQFHIITMVHCLEHMYKPLEALKKIRSMLAPEGMFFVRSPDHKSAGIERDFTSGHYDIHPLIWSEDALYEALAQIEDCFVVDETYPMYGQRDFFLRPISKAPTICAGYIAKNEERDLPASLNSISTVVDDACIVDTGSKDKTIEIAEVAGAKVEVYTEASTLVDGDWKLWNFAKARNQYVAMIDSEHDWLLWMDADDTVTPEAGKIIRRAPYMPYDMHGFIIKTGQDGHTHHRLWRTKHGVHYTGAVHEYPQWPSNFRVKEWTAPIIHNCAEGTGESSIMRNLRILEKECGDAGTPFNHRNTFYFANTLRDAYGIAGDKTYLSRAIEQYSRYIANPSHYHDELMFCYIYKARCARLLGDKDLCLKTVHEGMAKDSSFAELAMEAAYVETDNWKKIGWAVQTLDVPYRHRLFAEKNKYTDQPIRVITHAFNALQFPEVALAWGGKVFEHTDDPSWREFLSAIGGASTVNILRPGAIGDVIMCGWFVENLKKKHKGKVVVYTKCLEAAALIPDAEVRDSDEWASREKGIDFAAVGYPIREGYPEKPMTKHLLEYFAGEFGVEPKAPVLKSSETDETAIYGHRYATIHVKAGWSQYKNWPIARWEQVVDKLIAKFPDLMIVQIGGPDDPKLKERKEVFNLVGQTTLENVAELIRNADLHLGVDSFTNHIAGAYGKPAVILFGSTSPTGSGYPTARNLWADISCSPCYREDPKISSASRGVCPNPAGQTYENPQHACMDLIDVDEVVANASMELEAYHKKSVLKQRSALEEILRGTAVEDVQL